MNITKKRKFYTSQKVIKYKNQVLFQSFKLKLATADKFKNLMKNLEPKKAYQDDYISIIALKSM